MPTNKVLDDLATKLGEVFRSSPAKDIERNTRALLGTVFSKLDLVTRDEFEVQAQLLLRTREKLERLEARLAELQGAGRGEASAAGAPPPDSGAASAAAQQTER
jgi:BMFP domain-containing protein YqiC